MEYQKRPAGLSVGGAALAAAVVLVGLACHSADAQGKAAPAKKQVWHSKIQASAPPAAHADKKKPAAARNAAVSAVGTAAFVTFTPPDDTAAGPTTGTVKVNMVSTAPGNPTAKAASNKKPGGSH